MKILSLILLIVSLGMAETYSFSHESISCVEERAVLVACSGDSTPNSDGSSVHFFIEKGSLEVSQVLGGKVVYYSGPSPVTFGPGRTFHSPVAWGAFNLKQVSCSGGTKDSPESCRFVSVGSPSGTISLVGHVSKEEPKRSKNEK